MRRLWTLTSLCLLAACGGGGGTPPGPGPGPNPNPQPGACANLVDSDITISTTWRNGPAECDYLIRVVGSAGAVSVTNGTLTIEPGTVIRFVQDAALDIGSNARLVAVGTPQARIRFEGASAVKGFGKGVFFGPESLPSRLEYADFRFLGKEERGLGGFHDGAIAGLQNAPLTLKHTTVSGSVFYGLDMSELIVGEFADNAFSDNALFGVYTTARQVPKLDTASDYLGRGAPNGRPYVGVVGLFSGETVLESAAWERLNAPYFIATALYVEAGRLTLRPGVSLVMNRGASIKIEGPGALSAVGTAQEPVRIVGEQPGRGYWDEISFFQTASPDNRLDYAEVRGGGGGTIYQANIVMPLESRLSITNSTIADSAAWGVCVGFRSELAQSGNTFSGNTSGNVGDDAADDCG